jgi:hypothetical protein
VELNKGKNILQFIVASMIELLKGFLGIEDEF